MNRERLIKSLIHHEGIRNLPYEDSAGVLTIGVGHNLDDVPLSYRALEVILEDDIAIAEAELDKEWPQWRMGLSPTRQNVLIEMVFNLGWPRFSKFKKTIAAVNDKDYDTAADEMLDSQWAKQVGLRSLNLSEQMRTNKYYAG